MAWEDSFSPAAFMEKEATRGIKKPRKPSSVKTDILEVDGRKPRSLAIDLEKSGPDFTKPKFRK